MECAWFVFSMFLQSELDRIKNEWNTHFIRKSRSTTISGVPDELYFMPESQGKLDCGIPVTQFDINNILVQRDVHTEAINDIDADDDELTEYFLYVCSK